MNIKNKQMKKQKTSFIWITFVGITFFIACSTMESISMKNENKTSFRLYLGGSKGGFIEESDIDAISGATNSDDCIKEESNAKFCAGMHMDYQINNRHGFETGLDFVQHKQSIFYDDPALDMEGIVNIDYFRISMPLTYNYIAIKNKNENAILYLKSGLSLNYIHTNNTSIIGKVPDFKLKQFAVAPYFGINVIPISFENYSLGFFLNTSLLKGTKIFTDEIYHKSNNTGLLSTLEFGLNLNFSLKKK